MAPSLFTNREAPQKAKAHMQKYSSKTNSLLTVLALCIIAVLCVGCGTTAATTANPQTATAPAFIIGTDAPLPSVTSFSVEIQSIDAVTTSGTSVPLLSGSPTVDFARFNGLQTLLDMNDVPVGTYSSIVVTLGPATLGYLNVVAGSAPTIATEPAVLSTSTITTTLSTPLVVATSGPVGLHLDFDLHKSIQVDSNGQITGNVTPTFNLNVVDPSSSGAYIDEFDAAVVSVNTTAQSFVIQGPHGRNFTVNVNGQTEWSNNESLSSLSTSSIVQLSGDLDRADATIDADDVSILSQNGFYATGLMTYVNPTSGPASSFDLYVRGLLPTTTGLTLGQIAQIDLSGNENFFIHRMHDPLTEYLFNNSTLLAGQRVAIGGPASGATNPNDVSVKRVVLRCRGYDATVVPGSINPTNGTFQIQVNDFAGLLIPETVTVYTDPNTTFRDTLTTLSSVTDGLNVRVVGLFLKDPSSGNAILLARYVDVLN
jgi:FtsH-binding integral membrane protein